MDKLIFVCLLFGLAFGFSCKSDWICNNTLDICLRYCGFKVNNYQTAVEHCRERGEKLLEIKSKKIQIFTKNYLNNHIDPNEGYQFFMNLIRHDFKKDSQNGVFVNFRPRLLFRNQACDLNYFKCFTMGYMGAYVEYVTLNYSWYEARDYCHNLNMTLMDHDTVSEIEYFYLYKLRETFDNNRLHSRLLVKWVWYGEDKSPYYTNWKGGCDNTSLEDDLRCSVITADSTWMPSRCHLKESIPVICMKTMKIQIPNEKTINLYYILSICFGVGFATMFLLVIIFVCKDIMQGMKPKSDLPNTPTFRRQMEVINANTVSPYTNLSRVGQESNRYVPLNGIEDIERCEESHN